MTYSAVVLTLLIYLCSASRVAENPASQIRVPQGGPILIDGKLFPDEWKSASRQELKGGGEVFLQHDGTHLLVGLRGGSEGWSHVYVSDGKDIYVLHASAALGAAIYRQGAGNSWQPIQSFSWELRDRSQTPEALAAREAYLKANGWVASTSRMGNPGELEFMVSDKFRQGKSMSIAILYASNAKSPQYWPGQLADDCLKEELVFGKTPPGLVFNRQIWAKLIW